MRAFSAASNNGIGQSLSKRGGLAILIMLFVSFAGDEQSA
jgi:hypothetical protein